MKVEYFKDKNDKPIPFQFKIILNNGIAFQNYNSIIAFIRNDKKVILSSN